MKISRQVMLEWSWPGLELRFLDDDWFFPHISGFCQIRCHFLTSNASGWSPFLCCKFILLTNTLANHMGVMLASMRTIVCTPVFPHRDSNSRPHH